LTWKILNSHQLFFNSAKRKEVKVRLSDVVEKGLKKMGVTVSKPILAAITIIFGLIIIFWQESLNLIIGIYLLIQGVLLLMEYYELRSRAAPRS